MKAFGLLAGLALAAVAPAQAATVLSDNFDAEAGGATVTNYAGFANFDVQDGTVDLLHQPNQFGLTCFGGNGSSCVDLDGSTNNGGIMVTKSGFAFNAGDVVQLSFQVSGSQRVTAEDFVFGFRSGGGAIQYNNVIIDSDFYGFNSFGNFNVTDLNGSALGLPATTPYGFFSMRFTAGGAGSIKAYFGSNSADNIGVIVDDFALEIGAVPEPASWAMMIAGFGIVGASLRRRATRAALA
jgi:opacity protein-like surface antigen